MSSVIRVENLSKSYNGFPAVRDVSLSVEKGTVFGLLGTNGAGKSTVMECILGTKKPDSGQISVLDTDPRTGRKRLFERIGVQFQESGYPAAITAGELCEEHASLYRRPADIHDLLGRFGLSGKTKTPVGELSGGERQRLFIVLALLPGPDLVFLDELTTGLDVKARREVWRCLETLKAQGLTVFLTSHFMDEVETLCDRVCILKKGKIVFDGTVAQAVAASPCETFEDTYLWFTEEEETR